MINGQVDDDLGREHSLLNHPSHESIVVDMNIWYFIIISSHQCLMQIKMTHDTSSVYAQFVVTLQMHM